MSNCREEKVFDGVSPAYQQALIGYSVRTRAVASLVKSGSLAILAIAVLSMTAMRFAEGNPPEAHMMSLIALLALAAKFGKAYEDYCQTTRRWI